MEVGERLIQQEKQRVVAGFDFGDVADVDASTFSGAASFVFVNVGAKSFFLVALVCGAHERIIRFRVQSWQRRAAVRSLRRG